MLFNAATNRLMRFVALMKGSSYNYKLLTTGRTDLKLLVPVQDIKNCCILEQIIGGCLNFHKETIFVLFFHFRQPIKHFSNKNKYQKQENNGRKRDVVLGTLGGI